MLSSWNNAQFSSFQSLSHVRLFATPWTASTPGFPVLHQLLSLLKLMSIELVMPSNYLILCCPFLLLPSIFLIIRVFSNESALHIRGPKYWSFSFSISPSNEYSGLISFRIDWLDLLAVQGTLKSLLQHHSSNTPILWHSAFFMVSRLFRITRKTICWCLVIQLCPTLCDPMDCSTPSFPPSPRASPNSRSLSQWCHSTILWKAEEKVERMVAQWWPSS